MIQVSGRTAGVVTAVFAAGIVAMGITGASADDAVGGAGLKGAPSIETAPSLFCPSGERVLNVYGVGEQKGAVDQIVEPIGIVNHVVAATKGWTNEHANIVYTSARALEGSNPAMTEVDVRDSALNRIGVFVLTKDSELGWQLTRTFECKG